MTTLAEIRQRYPQYNDMSDDDLARALHGRYYSDIPFQQFADQVGFADPAESAPIPKGPTGRPVLARRSNMSKGEAALFGAGKFVDDIGTGATQLATGLAVKLGHLPESEADRLRKEVATTRVKDAALMRQPGAALGYMGAATVPAVGAAFIPGANTYAGSAMIGGAMGLLQPTEQAGQRGVNAALGAGAGFAGQGAANLIGRIAQPVRKALSPAEDAAVARLRAQGVPLSVGQQTGSRAAQGVERFLADNPVTAPAMARAGDQFRGGVTKAALRTAGINADNAGPEVLGPAIARVSSTLDDIARRYAPDPTEIAPGLAAIRGEADDLAQYGAPIIKILDKIEAQAQAGELTGELVAKYRTSLGRLSRDPYVGGLAGDLDEILQNGMQKAMQGTDDFARYAEARLHYKNINAIADATDSTARAQVAPAGLASKMKSSRFTKQAMKFGKGDQALPQLARDASTVVDRFPNSGTPARAMWQFAPGLAGAGAGMMQDDPMKALQWGLLGYLGPKAAVKMMTSPFAANYLAQGVQGGARLPLGLLSQAPLGPIAAAGLLTQQ